MNEWLRNPEFVRHLRAEMRPPRMMLSGGLAVVICFLVSLIHSQATAQGRGVGEPAIVYTLFFWLLCLQATILPLWCFSATLQAVASERQMKTYDFVRTTRLDSSELLVGYLFGTPIMAYFTVGVSAVIAFLSGLGEHVPIGAMVATYILLFIFCVFVSLCGLLVSMLVAKPRAAGSLLIVFLLTGPFAVLGFAATGSPFPGLASLALYPGLISLYDPTSTLPSSAPFFSLHVPYLILTTLLYVSFGAWLVMALVRNLKKEREEIQLLTRFQALGFAAYLNFLFLGFLHPVGPKAPYEELRGMSGVMIAFLLMNQMLFYVVGLSTLVPAERLKIWYRGLIAKQQSLLAEEGLPWPWMLLAGVIAFIAMSLASIGISTAQHQPWSAGATLLSVMIVLAFAVRDVLFLQWCMLTRMKSPIGKGIALIWLYYFAAAVIASFLTMGATGYRKAPTTLYVMLTPVGAWMPGNSDGVVAGLMLQSALCMGLLYLIRERLTQMELATAPA
jgi:hypothetical protein